MLLLKNRRAGFDYDILKKYEAGIVLSGPEVKSLRNKSGSLTGSFVKLMSDEAFLINAQISPYQFADNSEYDPKRTRKLLLRKKELQELTELSQQKGKTLVPLALVLSKNKIKLEFGVGRGRKQHDKRRVLKEKAQKRELERAIKNKNSRQ